MKIQRIVFNGAGIKIALGEGMAAKIVPCSLHFLAFEALACSGKIQTRDPGRKSHAFVLKAGGGNGEDEWYSYFNMKLNRIMKYFKISSLHCIMVFLISCGLLFCHGSGNTKFSDSINKTLPDTNGQQPIPGTPGPSGTAPSSRDTTQAFRDSLKKARHIYDSSSGPKTN